MSIVITGAAGALGSVTAKVLSDRGRAIALVDVPQADARLREVAGGLTKSVTRAFDIRTAAGWAEALPAIEHAVGETEGAVLIAGGWRGGKPLHEADDADWDAMLQMNLDTAQRSMRALLPGMVARKRGSIVVIGSRAAVRPWTSAGAAAYAAAKAAVVALAEAVAAEVRDAGVRVNAVLPSTLDTTANRRAMPDADPSRWVSLESAAGVVAFLLSDESRDISGAAIPLYGRA
jgi:NAD(P)-dependent dehydrogenase (short-subunit alcohol dehydrogenase family)